MSTILVTGASGFVGSHVIPVLLERGHRVAALVRSGDAGASVHVRLDPGDRERVEIRIGDVTDRPSLPGALAGTHAVVHLVAVPRDWDGGATLRLVNTEGTRNLIAAMTAAGVRRLVHQGALGVEDDPALHYASSKAKGERLVRESELDWTILKPSLLFGPRDGFFNIIASLVRWSPGVVPIAGRGGSRFQPLAIVDAARIIADVLERPDTIRHTYELGGPRIWTYREIVAEVIRAMGAHRLVLPMPVPLVSLVARSAELVRLPFPVASDQLHQLRLDNVTALDAVPAAFGFVPLDMAGRLGYLRDRPRDQEPA